MNQQSDAAWSVERLVAILRDLAKESELPEFLIDGEIKGSDTVETLGIDSIGAVALIDRLETEAGVMLPDDFVEFDESVEQIAQRMNTLT